MKLENLTKEEKIELLVWYYGTKREIIEEYYLDSTSDRAFKFMIEKYESE